MCESCGTGCKGIAALSRLLLCSAAQAMYGADSPAVAQTLYLLAMLHLQRWEYCHSTGSGADPAHLLRSANMATSASDSMNVRSCTGPGLLHGVLSMCSF